MNTQTRTLDNKLKFKQNPISVNVDKSTLGYCCLQNQWRTFKTKSFVK